VDRVRRSPRRFSEKQLSNIKKSPPIVQRNFSEVELVQRNFSEVVMVERNFSEEIIEFISGQGPPKPEKI